MGSLEILNVEGGEVRLTYDKKDSTDGYRAQRYIGEMMRAGFVLLVEVERDGEKRFERAQGFDANTCEYIIADFEPNNGATPDAANGDEDDKPKRGRRKKIAMEDADATAVGPSAGG